jgi:hypothetical protein
MQPFPCERPHGLLIDVVVQGGSSGSPIFNPITGKVAALLYGGLIENNVIPLPNGAKLPYTYGTSLTLSIPAYIIADLLKMNLYDKKTGEISGRDTSKHPTLAEMFATQEMKVRPPKQAAPDAEEVPASDIEYPKSK